MKPATPMKLARIRLGFSQWDLAMEVGASQAQIWNWEQGRRLPPPAIMKKISKVLQTAVETLFPPVTKVA